MGVLNLTPDSFSDGGQFNAPDLAIQRIREMIAQGADIIDIGGESTGPGSSAVSTDEELARVRPVIEIVAEKKLTDKALFSIDTYKAPVAKYALEHGFQMVNDVTALRGDPKMIEVLLKYEPYVVLMYSKDPTPRTTREDVEYDDVMAGIKTFLLERVSTLIEAGFPEDKIIIDPGMGAFISSIPDYSFEVIHRLKELRLLGFPILVGISRKSCLSAGQAGLGGKLEDRDQPSVDWSLKALQNGASIIRIHNVELMKKALPKEGFLSS
ncbi:MAG: dihydropteroate synthase [Patescibacteria group bacterium]